MTKLYHGSSQKLNGEYLLPSQGDDDESRPENNLLAVYATDREDLAIVMAIIGCSDVIGGSIDEYTDKGKLNATLYGDFPKQQSIYVHELPSTTFTQTKIDKHQFVSLQKVKPLNTKQLNIAEYHQLFKRASPEQTRKWLEKYG